MGCLWETKDKYKEIIFAFCRSTIDLYTIYINYLFPLSNKMYSCKIRGNLTLTEINVPFKSLLLPLNMLLLSQVSYVRKNKNKAYWKFDN